MASIVTDQLRILNANNFIESVSDSNNSYYVFVGLSNPTQVGFGRTGDWNTNVPNPIDSTAKTSLSTNWKPYSETPQALDDGGNIIYNKKNTVKK